MYTMTMRNPGANGYNDQPFLKLYDPTLTEYGLETPEMQLEANMIGGLTFTIYDWNPRFNDLQLRKTAIYLYRDGVLRMAFRPIKRRLTFQGGVEYTCEELTGLLNDIMIALPDMASTNAGEVILHILGAWATEAAQETVVIPDKAVLASLLNEERTAFVTLRPDSQNLYAGLHTSLRTAYELNTALYMLGFPVNRNLTWFYQQDAVRTFMQWAVAHHELGMTTTQAQINASSKGYYWIPANDTTNPTKGPYYDLLKLVNDTLDGAEYGPNYQYKSLFLAGFVCNTTTDVPASDYIHDKQGNIDIEKTEYIGCWDLLQQTLVDEYGGYILPVWESETQCRIRYVTDDDLPMSNQSIVFGENMADLFVERDSTDVYTTIIPVKEDGTTWDIGSIPAQNGQKFVVLEELFQLYGRKDMTKEFTGANVTEVYDKILEWVKDSTPIFKPFIQARAYDLKYAGVDVNYLTWMERIPVISDKHKVLETYPIRAATESLDSPDANEYELGEEPPSIADQVNDEVKTLEQIERKSKEADDAISKNTTKINSHTVEINNLDNRVSRLEGN